MYAGDDSHRSLILELSVRLAHFTPLKDSGTLYPYPELSLPVSPSGYIIPILPLPLLCVPFLYGPSLGDRAQLNPVYLHDKEHLYTPRGWWTLCAATVYKRLSVLGVHSSLLGLVSCPLSTGCNLGQRAC